MKTAINPLHVFVLGAAVMILGSIVYTGVEKAIKLTKDIQSEKEVRCSGKRCDLYTSK